MFDMKVEDMPTGADKAMPLMTPQQAQDTRPARRLYVGNIPIDTPAEELVAFFNEAMIKAGLNKWAGPPISSAVHQAQGFCFLEAPRDAAEMQPRCSRDAAEMRRRCNRC